MSFLSPEPLSVDGSLFRVAIAAARYNQDLVDDLLEKAIFGLHEAGVKESAVEVVRVPGSNEVPYAIQMQAESGTFDCCLALGVLIKGATAHYHIVAQSASDALQMTALNTGIPVINGIVVADSRAQAMERIQGGLNRGAEFAHAVLEMAALKHRQESSRHE